MVDTFHSSSGQQLFIVLVKHNSQQHIWCKNHGSELIGNTHFVGNPVKNHRFFHPVDEGWPYDELCNRWWDDGYVMAYDYDDLVGGLWLPSMTYFPMNIGFLSSSQLTKSYFSEGWPNHQPVMVCVMVDCGWWWFFMAIIEVQIEYDRMWFIFGDPRTMVSIGDASWLIVVANGDFLGDKWW